MVVVFWSLWSARSLHVTILNSVYIRRISHKDGCHGKWTLYFLRKSPFRIPSLWVENVRKSNHFSCMTKDESGVKFQYVNVNLSIFDFLLEISKSIWSLNIYFLYHPQKKSRTQTFISPKQTLEVVKLEDLLSSQLFNVWCPATEKNPLAPTLSLGR